MPHRVEPWGFLAGPGVAALESRVSRDIAVSANADGFGIHVASFAML